MQAPPQPRVSTPEASIATLAAGLARSCIDKRAGAHVHLLHSPRTSDGSEDAHLAPAKAEFGNLSVEDEAVPIVQPMEAIEIEEEEDTAAPSIREPHGHQPSPSDGNGSPAGCGGRRWSDGAGGEGSGIQEQEVRHSRPWAVGGCGEGPAVCSCCEVTTQPCPAGQIVIRLIAVSVFCCFDGACDGAQSYVVSVKKIERKVRKELHVGCGSDWSMEAAQRAVMSDNE